MSPAVLAPLVVLLFIALLDAWVYSDARSHLERGETVRFQAGNFVVDRPETWTAGCLLLFVVFFPLYIVCRSS